jgi:hypothetical protein
LYLFFNRRPHCKIPAPLLDNGANIDRKGWIQISNVWKFGTPLELAFQLLSEKDTVIWKNSVQNLINILLENQKQLSLNMSEEGKR